MALNSTSEDVPVPKLRLFLMIVPIILLTEVATFEILMVFPALPKMAAHFQTLNVAWVASIVTLTGAVVLPLAGKAGDRFGKKRVLTVLAAVFLAGSVLCAVTDSFALMLLGRALQGPLVGIVSLSYSLVRDILPRSQVPVALGTVVTGVGMGAVAGPFVAGWLVDSFGYQGVFWFLIVYIAVVLPVFLVTVPESPVRVRARMDYVGALLLGVSLTALMVGLGGGAKQGWTSPTTLGLVGLGLVVLAVFVLVETRSKEPLIDLRLLVGRKFGATVVAVGLISYMMNAHAVSSPTIFQTPPFPGNGYGVGLSAVELAVWTFPLGAVAMVAGPLGGHLSRRIGARNVLLASGLLFLVVQFLGARLFTVQWQVAITSVIGGFAVGFLHSSNANLLQDALPKRESGVGNGIAGVIALVAAAAGTAVTGSVMAQHVRTVLPGSHTVIYADSAFTSSYLVSGIVGVVGVLVVLMMRHGRQPAQGGLDTEDGVVRAEEVKTA